MYCTSCGTQVDRQHRFCAACGAQVEVATGDLAPAATVADAVAAAGVSAALAAAGWNWRRGMHGLVGYVSVQVVLFLVLGRDLADAGREWPLYLFFAALWTVTFSLGLSNGAAWGVVLGVFLLDLVLFGTAPVWNAWAAVDRVLSDTFFGLVVLAVTGLVRGQLEWIGLRSRAAVATLFAWAGGVLVLDTVLLSFFE